MANGSMPDAGDRATYERVTAVNARGLARLVRPGDVVVLHDPQTAGLVEPLMEHVETGITAPIAHSVTWLTMRATELLTGDAEPPPLNEVARDVPVPVLLIASRAPGELALDRLYRDRVGAGAALWHVDDVDHTEALARHPRAYSQRLDTWLAAVLD